MRRPWLALERPHLGAPCTLLDKFARWHRPTTRFRFDLVAVVRLVGEFPGGQFAGGPLEAVGDGFVGGCGWDLREGLAVEGVDGGGEVEVVGVSAAGDVDVGLGAGGGGVDAAGGDVVGGALDGVAGEGVGVVDADFAAPAAGAVVVEEAAGQVDGADAVEVDGDPVVVLLVAVVDGGDGAERSVADVGAAVAVGVEVAVGGAGGDTVADGEAAVVAGDDLVGADLAVDLAELVGEAVELAAGGVASGRPSGGRGLRGGRPTSGRGRGGTWRGRRRRRGGARLAGGGRGRRRSGRRAGLRRRRGRWGPDPVGGDQFGGVSLRGARRALGTCRRRRWRRAGRGRR